ALGGPRPSPDRGFPARAAGGRDGRGRDPRRGRGRRQRPARLLRRGAGRGARPGAHRPRARRTPRRRRPALRRPLARLARGLRRPHRRRGRPVDFTTVTAQQAKQIVKNALYRTIGETSTTLRLTPNGANTLRVLMYHKVNDIPENPTTV